MPDGTPFHPDPEVVAGVLRLSGHTETHTPSDAEIEAALDQAMTDAGLDPQDADREAYLGAVHEQIQRSGSPRWTVPPSPAGSP